MSIPQFAHSDLRTAVRDEIHGTVSPSATTQEDRMIRRAVRFVVNDIDLRSQKKRTMLSLSGANDIANEGVSGNYSSTVRTDVQTEADDYIFHAPLDIKGAAIINIAKRYSQIREYELVAEEEFIRKKSPSQSLVAFKESSFLKQLLVTGVEDLTNTTLHNCDTYNGNGTWAVDGAEITAVATVTDNYIDGVGAIGFTTATGALVGGTLTVSDMTAVDLSGHTNDSIYAWVYIPFATGLTSFTLKWGSDASNYYSKVITKTHDNTAFQTGWNLLRFPYIGATETGTVDDENIDYIQLIVIKGASNTGTTGWILDGLRAQKDSERDVVYYTKYGWQNTSGVYLETSSADSDLLNCMEDEFELFVFKCAEYISRGVLNIREDAEYFKNAYEDKKKLYVMDNQSERMILTSSYQEFGGISGFEDEVI